MQDNSLPPMLILCGGFGTRLRAAVSDRPKPLAEVAGKPFLEHLLAEFRSQGVDRFVLCAGHLGEQIAQHFAQDPQVSVVIEPAPLGTGGSLALGCASFPDETFFVANGDSFCRVSLERLLTRLKSPAALGVLSVIALQNQGDYGTIRFDEAYRLTRFEEKVSSQEEICFINAGVYCFSREVLHFMPAGRCSLEREIFPTLAAQGRLYVEPSESPLLDIGTPERLARAALELARIQAQPRLSSRM